MCDAQERSAYADGRYAVTDDYGYEFPEDTELIPIEELNTGDVIPSHDGRVHSVKSMDYGTDLITVEFYRDGGDEYVTQFEYDADIHVRL